jgi:glycosyltransferase involved in cell wall biosynthesis
MLSKACIVGIYQSKLEEIAKFPNIDLKVLVPPSWRDKQGETFLERTFMDGYDLTVTPIRFNGSYHLHYYPQFAKHVADFQPDIIHIDEEPYNLATWLALRTAHKFKAKTIFFSWQNIARRYPFPFHQMENAALNSVDYAIVGTESAAQVWRQKGFTGKLAVIPQFGVDPDLFQPPTNNPSPKTTLKIGYAGRLWIGKGVDLLINALNTIRHLNWHLELIGSGPQESELIAQINRLNLTDRVTLTKWVPSVEMPRHFQKLDLLVIPSRTRDSWKEQYGRVIIEAMSTGLPIIGSDSGAIPDVIGDAGLIFPEDDCPALATHLRHLIENESLRRELGQKGRDRILTHFTQQQVAAKTVAVYEELHQSPLS